MQRQRIEMNKRNDTFDRTLVTCPKCGKSGRHGIATHIKYCLWGLNADYLWPRVDRRGPDECWPWKKAIGTHGYGKIHLHRKNTDAHRVAWTVTHGSIPDGMQVLHRCDNRACCNPAHLFLGTNEDNMRDKALKQRVQNSTLTHDQVREIKKSLAQGGHGINASLARKYGVSPTTIGSIKSGRNFEYIT